MIALREIADETVDLTVLADALVKGHQRQVEFDEPEEEAADFELPQVPGELMSQTAAPSEVEETSEETADDDEGEPDEAADQLEAGALEDESE